MSSKCELIVKVLTDLMPWFFSLDHVHYARCLSVHLRYLFELKRRHPSVHQIFCCDASTVNKTKRPFSAVASDQAPEQCNKTIKGDGDAVAFTSNLGALRRYVTADPEIAQFLSNLEH